MDEVATETVCVRVLLFSPTDRSSAIAPAHQVCVSLHEVAHYHILGLELSASPVTWYSAGVGERWISVVIALLAVNSCSFRT
jgi:hypothetical protein